MHDSTFEEEKVRCFSLLLLYQGLQTGQINLFYECVIKSIVIVIRDPSRQLIRDSLSLSALASDHL